MIIELQGQHRWLSNFYPCNIVHDGIVYPSVEHFYVAMKTTDESKREEIRNIVDAGHVKRLGRTLEIRADWEQIKVDVMRYAISRKFSDDNPDLKEKLIATGQQHIQEGNRWGDTFWGVCLRTNTGQNRLGSILMELRSQLQRNK